MKKIYLTIYTFLHHLFEGLHNADNVAFSQNNDDENDNGGNIEIKNEKHSVYNDLLKGELTQEVKELRHEMYVAERESHKYEYVGGGIAKKKKNRFSDRPNVEEEDGYTLQILQGNNEITESVTDGIYSDTVGTKNNRDFTIIINRDFNPRFKLEEYATKVLIYRGDDDNVLVKLYMSKYLKQFDKRHRFFMNELKRVVDENDVRSELLEFDTLEFITYKAWGAEDLHMYKYGNLKYRDSKETEDSYVLTFNSIVIDDGVDMTAQFLDEIAAKKFADKAPRKENSTLDFDVAARAIERENDEELLEMQNMINNFRNNV